MANITRTIRIVIVNVAIHNLIRVALAMSAVTVSSVASSSATADRLDRPDYDYSSADLYLELYALALSAMDHRPHALVSMKVPSASGQTGELAVLREAPGSTRRLEAVVLDDSFTLTTFVKFAVGPDDGARYAIAFSHMAGALRMRVHDRSGARVAESMIEDDIRLPVRLLPDTSGFILVTPHQLLRADSEARVVDRIALKEGKFADALLLPTRDCPLLTLITSGADDEEVSLERRCLDGAFTVRHVVRLARGGFYRMPRLTAGTPGMTALVSEPVGTKQGAWTISICELDEPKPECNARTISGVPFNPIQLLDGLQVRGSSGRGVQVTALDAEAQTLWHGLYGSRGRPLSARDAEALPAVPDGYTIGHHALTAGTGDQVWTALAYMRVWGDKTPEGERPHSAADMHISLYKEPAPR